MGQLAVEDISLRGTRSYGTTKRGAYMCEKEAIGVENRASKTESFP
jgi:hypothetical protein